jgi:hypothetical protein
MPAAWRFDETEKTGQQDASVDPNHTNALDSSPNECDLCHSSLGNLNGHFSQERGLQRGKLLKCGR